MATLRPLQTGPVCRITIPKVGRDKSFVDDLNKERGIVSYESSPCATICWDSALVPSICSFFERSSSPSPHIYSSSLSWARPLFIPLRKPKRAFEHAGFDSQSAFLQNNSKSRFFSVLFVTLKNNRIPYGVSVSIFSLNLTSKYLTLLWLLTKTPFMSQSF